MSALIGHQKKSDSLCEIFDTSHLTNFSDINAAYEALHREEETVTKRLEWSVGNRHHLEAKLCQLAHLVPTLQLLHSDAKQLENTISFTHQLATAVSAKVRQVDLAKSRVADAQQKANDLLDLEGCSDGVATALAQEDFEKAASHVHRFLSMDETILKHAMNTSHGGSVEMWFERLRSAEKQLYSLVVTHFDEAVTCGDTASVDRFFKLFPLLNKHVEGLDKFSGYLCSKIREKSEENLNSALKMGPRDKRAHVIWADTITLLFEFIARVLEARQPIIETYYKPGHLSVVVNVLQQECDAQAAKIIAEMKKSRKLDVVSSAVQTSLRQLTTQQLMAPKDVSSLEVIDPRDLDLLLGELTLMNARAELYLRFLKRRVHADVEAAEADCVKRCEREQQFDKGLSRSQLACDMAVLIGTYTILEQFYLNESFKKAVTVDALDSQSQTSSLVDDAFFIVKKSIRRAIASSSIDGVCAVINHSVDLLERQLAAGFHQILRKGFPVQGYMDFSQAYNVLQSINLQSGRTNVAASDSDAARQSFLTALNNAETSIRHISSLHQSITETISAALTGLSDTDTGKIDSCLGDLKGSAARFGTVVEFGLSQLQATALKPRMKSWVDSFISTSHNITEEEFSSYEANDPFSQSLLIQIDGFLVSFQSILTPENHKSFVERLVKELALQLEKAVLKSSFNRLGGLQFDREMRAIASYLSQVSEWSVREQLSRLTQMATLLNVENLSEVSEYYSSANCKLTSHDMKHILRLRVDFKPDEVQKLKL